MTNKTIRKEVKYGGDTNYHCVDIANNSVSNHETLKQSSSGLTPDSNGELSNKVLILKLRSEMKGKYTCNGMPVGKKNFFFPHYALWMQYGDNKCYTDVMADRIRETFMKQLMKRYRDYLQAEGIYDPKQESDIHQAAKIEMRYLELSMMNRHMTFKGCEYIETSYDHLQDVYERFMVKLGIRYPNYAKAIRAFDQYPDDQYPEADGVLRHNAKA